MPSIRLSKSDRENLLVKLRDGHDLESAGAALGLSEGEIGIAKDKYGTEMATEHSKPAQPAYAPELWIPLCLTITPRFC